MIDPGRPFSKSYKDLIELFEERIREGSAGLTDFRPGSVTGTLIRTVAREIKLLYEQMDQAYRRAFIDIATGVALDNVVALVGVTRNPALKATGQVTFSRKKPAETNIEIELNTRVADESGRTFVTTEEAAIHEQEKSVTVPIEAVKPGPDGNVNAGTIVIMPTPPTGVDEVTNEEFTAGGTEAEADDRLRERAKHALEQAGNATLNAIKFAVLDVDGVEEVQVLDHNIDSGIPLGEISVRYIGAASPEAVKEAVERTRAAGILARLQTIKEILISGKFYLIPDDVADPEPAKENFLKAVVEFIESLSIGQALSVRRLNALAFGISGLADVAEAHLKYRYRDKPGGDVPDPFVINNDELLRPDRPGAGSGASSGSGQTGAGPGASLGQAETGIESGGSLEAGEVAVGSGGSVEVEVGGVGAPEETETGLDARFVQSLKAIETLKVGDDTHVIKLQIIDDSGKAVRFKDFALDLNVTLQAYLKTSNQQTENIGNFPKSIHFKDADTATLTISSTEISETHFDPDKHKAEDINVRISVPAYPGIKGTETTITILNER